MQRKKISLSDLLKMKSNGEKITMLTAYDYPFGKLIDHAGVEIILVGDSLGNVVLGYDNPVPVTMDEMLHHSKAVRKGVEFAFLVSDMPFMSFNVSCEHAIINAGRFIKEAGADAVKIEGGTNAVVETIKAIIAAGIPVMGHLGLTPQTAPMLGGYKVQGKDRESAEKILNQALALESAGCFCIVFECVPDKLAGLITKKLRIPTIGIGAGAECDGQVLVIHDLLGINNKFMPKFVRQYANLGEVITQSVQDYICEVKQKKFPAEEHCFKINADNLPNLYTQT
ncbi:MAG: 3-methyl-2-oxobutanoate hydroxymethyltransferase [Candidatus Omnitrophota bacterium]|nr:MAG: 3-methyl-2-oxobutanoate hydroxymethyltransferase [Candidatus Omnitrophota bacterium]